MNESLLYVGNLPYSIEKDDLEAIFLNAGNVLSATLPPRQSDGRSMGFGFVEMASYEEAKKALEFVFLWKCHTDVRFVRRRR